MIGLELFLIPFVVLAIAALAVIIKKFCREPKDGNQRKEDRGFFISVLAIFLAAVIIRLLFLS